MSDLKTESRVQANSNRIWWTHSLSNETTQALQELVKSIQRRANPKIELLGIVLSRIVSHRNITEFYLDACKKQFGEHLLSTVIKELNKFHVATAAGLPISVAQPTSTEADLFRALAKEIHL